MKKILFSSVINEILKRERGISFSEIAEAVDRNAVIRILKNPNQKDYKGQRFMIVNINQYAYVVPLKEAETEVIWITIFPSRKYTKKFIKNLK